MTGLPLWSIIMLLPYGYVGKCGAPNMVRVPGDREGSIQERVLAAQLKAF